MSKVGLSQKATKYSNEFLNIGVGARALGMSNSVVASTQDVFSGYWNPAGLLGVKDNIQLSLMHAEYFAGIANYDYGGFATKPTKDQALGFSFVRFGVDGILNTFDLIRNGEINYDRVSTFSSVDYAFIFSYAQNLKLKKLRGSKATFGWGTNAKIIHRKVGPFAQAWGFGFDVGAQLLVPESGWSFGAVAKDVTSTFNAWSYTFTETQKDILAQTGNTIPVNTLEITLPRFILGAAKQFEKNNWSFKTELNLSLTTDGKRNTLARTNFISFDPTFGIEVGYALNDEENKIFLRSGVGNFQRELNPKNNTVLTIQPNIGLGLKIKNFSLDYAFTDIGDQSAALYSNVVSIRIGINKQ